MLNTYASQFLPQRKLVYNWNINGYFSWTFCNFTQFLPNIITSAVHTLPPVIQVVSWVRHDRTVRLIGGTKSLPLFWLHRLVKRGMYSEWSKTVTKAVNPCSRSCVRVFVWGFALSCWGKTVSILGQTLRICSFSFCSVRT